MKTASSPSPTASVPTASGGGSVKRAGLVAALTALLAIVWMPTPQRLPPAGQVMLVTLAFAAIVWMSEALDHAVSSVVIAASMVILLGYAPDAARPGGVYVGTGAAIGLA
ncbi:anion permease, partial [Polaromonas sp.]|uniref:anion permease n=1 Tax=Polaromonas sp. TaxID=1869339 RepID=UPI0017926198